MINYLLIGQAWFLLSQLQPRQQPISSIKQGDQFEG